jgi:hypothetical protein
MAGHERNTDKAPGEHGDRSRKQAGEQAPRKQYPFPQTPEAQMAFRALVRATQFLPPVNRKEPRALYFDTQRIEPDKEKAE